MHQGELAWVIKLKAGNALSRRGHGRCRKFAQFTAIDEGLEDVLLDVEIIVVDGRHRVAQGRQIWHRFSRYPLGASGSPASDVD
jgi:hypothetical protein